MGRRGMRKSTLAALALLAACASHNREGPIAEPGAAIATPAVSPTAGGATAAQPTSGTGSQPTPGAASQLTAAELEALYRARADSALLRFTAADAMFVTDMIGHHAQAIVMARMAPTHGASATIRTLASRIINAQNDEIALMQRWLKDRGQPVPEIMYMGNDVMLHGVDHSMAMPGMLTPAQIADLDRARGVQFDRAFLTFMIQHHKGAVEMVEKLFATDGAAQERSVFKLASDVQVDQRTEIQRMELMLAQMP
jgi:uncharacterized protein (DUF305 family)